MRLSRSRGTPCPRGERESLSAAVWSSWPFFHPIFRFFRPWGYSCRYALGMAKPPSTPGGVRQRTGTKISRLSWTLPIRAKAEFLTFRGGGCGTDARPVYTRKGHGRKASAHFLHPIRGELNIPTKPLCRTWAALKNSLFLWATMYPGRSGPGCLAVVCPLNDRSLEASTRHTRKSPIECSSYHIRRAHNLRAAPAGPPRCAPCM